MGRRAPADARRGARRQPRHLGRLIDALVDTSILLGPTPRLERFGPQWFISVVTVGELEAGILLARDSRTRAFRLRRLADYTVSASILSVDPTIASRYAELRAAAGRQPSNDLWIAATALAHGLRLLTADARQAALPLVNAVYVGRDAEEA